jgi:rare lipoprotein A
MRRLTALLVLLLLLVPGSLWASGPAKDTAHSPQPYQVGKASWYGKYFHGRTTANGETYDMFQFTAAHRELPMGTWLKVTNLRTGKWIIVRVNDRGPYVGQRIIDLSYGAAQMLGFRERGLEKVRLDIIRPDTVARLGGPVGRD